LFNVSGRGWVAAGDLNVGDEVYLIDGSTAFVTGAELEQLEEPIKVYNLEIEGLNTYFVGDDGVLVHNYQDVNDKPKEDHHIATKYGEWGKKFKAIFDKYNIPMDDESNMVNLHHRGRHAKEYHELYMFYYRILMI